ncbi:hypothetical protein F4813DRAFT_199684 [Daldinia decipiens]|uniref:uncharacterized protein n=1 Tax=Daldinia decipiens TaxID=326647 RepID=UPI0020C215E1|nr:uncharacterized protein F4813DRAFT_199684 [Daldinia decipiens]KAI1654669.1 hypothetical protein F4813DRAFT_199684 [Daldinia decipiens]
METAATSFTSRRPAAHTLPQFHLPLPTPIDNQVPSMNRTTYICNMNLLATILPLSLPLLDLLRFPSYPIQDVVEMTASIPRLRSSNMLEYSPLTCVTGVTGIDSLSPISPGANNHSSQHSQAGLPFNSQQRLWAATGTQSYTHSPMSHGGQPPLMQQNYNRPIYSPNSAYRGSQSPGTVDILGASPYDSGSSPYQLSISGSLGHSNILSPAPNQTSLPMMNSHPQGSQPTAPSTSAGPPDAYSRPPTASGYYSGPSSSTTPHTSYPSFTSTHTSSSQSSSITTGSLSKNASTLSPHQQHSPMHSPMQAPPYRPLPSYTLPQTMGGGSTVGGPIMSNMTNPGGQMTIMNGIGTMGHGYHPTGHLVNQHLYTNNHHPITQDRPFKCDLCPTSFNRNHDLKRHKRIHLAIKPFPCTFCEKSFSRKDALKRHRMVKGCGIGKTPPNDGSGSSPREDTKRDADSHSGSEYGIKQEPL